MESLYIAVIPIFLLIFVFFIGIVYFRSKHYVELEKEAKNAFKHLIDNYGFKKLDSGDIEYQNLKKNLIFYHFWGDIFREAPARELFMLTEKIDNSHRIYVEAEAHRTLRFSITFKRINFYRPVLLIPLELIDILEDDIMVYRYSIRYIDVSQKTPQIKNALPEFMSKFILRVRDKNKKEINLPESIQKVFLEHCGKYPLDGREDIHNLTSPQNVVLGKNGIVITARPSTDKEIMYLIEFGLKLANQLKNLKSSESITLKSGK